MFFENIIGYSNVGVCFEYYNLTGSVPSNNLFYLNNFINNSMQISGLFLENAGNTVDASYSNNWSQNQQGNYWDTYLVECPNVKEINNTRIGNTPYLLDVSNSDNYPLMIPYGKLPVSTPDGVPELPAKSETIETEPFPFVPVTASIAIVAIVSVSLLIYFKKHKQHVSQETLTNI